MSDASPTLLATFLLDAKGQIHAEFLNPTFEREVREFGLTMPVGASKPYVFLEDGAAFFDNLEHALANSSLLNVVEE